MKQKITIGMCVKECEETIREAIGSVVNQDYPHEVMEIIFVDGDSQDNTLATVNSEISQMNIDVKIFSDRGKGLGVARQIVVDNACGEYILWVDGDIILEKNYLRKQVEFMDNNPKIGAAQGQWEISKTRTLAAALDNLSSFISFIIYDLKSKKSSLNSLGSVGGIYRVEAIRDVGGYDTRIKGAAEDWDLTSRMRKAGWLLSINQAKLYHIYKETWIGLWRKYSWWGYGDHYLTHKHKGLVIVWQKVPIITFATGLIRSLEIYKKTNQKKAFLLPFHNYFRSIAWCSGFIKSHINAYGHGIK